VNPRPVRRGALTAVAATLLLAVPAGAHPYFDPREVPVDSRAELTLELAHGCGVDDHDDGHAHGDESDEQPTREVAVEVPAAVSWVDATEADGWELELERDDAGEVEVIVFTAEEGTDVPAPAFELAAVHEGEVGDEVHWRVMQACDDATYRWVGTPDEPAEDPAVTVALVEADPDSPPPPPEEAGDDDGADVDEPDVEAPEDADGEVDDPAALDDEDLGMDADEPAATADEGGMPGWVLIVVLLAALAVAGAVLLMRGREDGGSGSTEPGSDRP
jgi:uncharacterized protein YcnI